MANYGKLPKLRDSSLGLKLGLDKDRSMYLYLICRVVPFITCLTSELAGFKEWHKISKC